MSLALIGGPRYPTPAQALAELPAPTMRSHDSAEQRPSPANKQGQAQHWRSNSNGGAVMQSTKTLRSFAATAGGRVR